MPEQGISLEVCKWSVSPVSAAILVRILGKSGKQKVMETMQIDLAPHCHRSASVGEVCCSHYPRMDAALDTVLPDLCTKRGLKKALMVTYGERIGRKGTECFWGFLPLDIPVSHLYLTFSQLNTTWRCNCEFVGLLQSLTACLLKPNLATTNPHFLDV